MKTACRDKNRGMSNFFWTLFSKFCLRLLSLRYRVKIKGLDQLKRSNLKKGLLFLPNHPAHIDPLLLALLLWPYYRMRPLVIEYIYRLFFMKPMLKLVRAVVIPDFDTSVNQLKIQKGAKALQEMADGLKRGENFLIYPSGRLKSSGKEILGGSSGAHGLVQECPNANIVLVRTSGLWGSSLSRAFEGISPDLFTVTWNGIKTIFKNGIFFCPRRNIEIALELNPKDLPLGASRIEFNRYLENWYNRYPDAEGNILETEPLQLVSYSFWRKDIPEIVQPKKSSITNGAVAISDATQKKIIDELRRILDNPNLVITAEKNLALDLGMDSLNIAELIAYITKNYDVNELHPEDIATVQDVFELADGRKAINRSMHPKGQARWPLEEGRPEVMAPFGKTIAEAFLNASDRMGHFACCGDDLVGVLSYKKLKRSALVLSLYFRKKPEKYVAVLLPASVGAYVVILALQLAGKVPVMLNWTLGPRYLEEMRQVSGAKEVITSWLFLEKLSHVDFGDLTNKIEFLEDIRQNLTIWNKLYGVFLSMQGALSIVRFLKLDRLQPDDPCVILFTSGTEASPKGVPLSHNNIISNQRSAMQCIDAVKTDVMYGVLPPFHSFGFSVAGLFALFCGIRIAFYPDPTDGFALAEGIERWEATLFCSPPSFLKGLFSAAKAEQLKTVRFFITGAEKAPAELFERVEKLKNGAILIEGYGITECSPIVTITRINLPPKGVGALLSGMELCTIHVETSQLLPFGSEGEICLRGPNVFSGYLGNASIPFIEIDGKKWYRTGDIGYLDADGNLILSGRLKRFTKLGGEMISLSAVETALSQELLSRGKISPDTPSLAVCSDERILGKPRLILFVTMPLQEEEANEMLKKQGFSRLVKIFKVISVEEIPLMSTGKTNYRQLQTILCN